MCIIFAIYIPPHITQFLDMTEQPGMKRTDIIVDEGSLVTVFTF